MRSSLTSVIPACFAATYPEARQRFRERATAGGLALTAHRHPASGPDGSELALDIARAGPAAAAAVLLLSSGCHGIEGFCGSGIQSALLADREVAARATAAGVTLVYLHALNPWGFAFGRRVDDGNVDLNRNFLDFSTALPPAEAYDRIAGWLVPRRWPAPAATLALIAYATRHGARALQQALSGGQSGHPDGLFYTGRAPSWSQQALRTTLRTEAARAERLGWIDLHSGLGPRGHGEAILACPNDPVTVARAKDWWGDVRSTEDDTSVSARLTGTMWHAAVEECPAAQFTGIALEFGTRSAWKVLQALRADHWLAAHGGAASAAMRARIARRLRDAFFVERDDWKANVVARARHVVLQAIEGITA